MLHDKSAKKKNIFSWALIFLIQLYQILISPWILPSCRFFPSCSQYAIDAIERNGAVKGTLYAVVRLLKCHPFHPGGYDPAR